MNSLAQSPSTFTIQTNKLAERLTVSQVCMIIKCLSGIGSKTLSINHRSSPQGHAGERWMEVEGEQYRLGLWVSDGVNGSIYEAFYCKTPKGAEWFAPQDQGKPFAKFSANEIEAINHALYVGFPEDDYEVVVVPLFRIGIRSKDSGLSFVGGSQDLGTINGIPFPKELLGHASFASKVEAELVRTAYETYRKTALQEQRRLKDNPPPKSKKKS